MKGVYWQPDRELWRAELIRKGRRHHLGAFKDEAQAVEAVQRFIATYDPPPAPPGYKRCSQCEKVKWQDEFHEDPRGEFGRRAACRYCINARVNRWRKSNPEKYAAHMKVSAAVQAGELIRPDSCAGCGAEEEVEAHHDDYDRPLDVRWLCHCCHVAQHRPTGSRALRGGEETPDA